MQTAGQTAYAEEVELTARRIFDLISPELQLVEEEFERQARSNIQVIAYIGDYLRRSGGKRVRPGLTILSNYAVGGDGSNYSSIRMATVMEFLHTATLVHDDVIDKAETRRNRPSINSEFGNQTAVLMGDWLYMSAFETSLAERSLPILDILTAVTRKMTEGELLQLTLLGRTDISEEQYFDVIARKTAYLFSACCEIGALLGGADLKTQTLLRDYGMNLGVAFQLVDDLLDFTSVSPANHAVIAHLPRASNSCRSVCSAAPVRWKPRSICKAHSVRRSISRCAAAISMRMRSRSRWLAPSSPASAAACRRSGCGVDGHSMTLSR